MLHYESYRSLIWKQFRKNPIGLVALSFFILFFLIGLYAPILASSKPLMVVWNGKPYFPLLRYLFYRGYFSKPIDLFYNLLMFTLPLTLGLYLLLKSKWVVWVMLFVQGALFIWLLSGVVKDPASSLALAQNRQNAFLASQTYRTDPLLSPITPYMGWNVEQKYMTNYGKLSLLLKERTIQQQHSRLMKYEAAYEGRFHRVMPTLWTVAQRNDDDKREQLQQLLQNMHPAYEQAINQWPELLSRYTPHSHQYLMTRFALDQAKEEIEHSDQIETLLVAGSEARTALANARSVIKRYRDANASLAFLDEKKAWLEKEASNLKVIIPPLLRPFHWEDDAGGAQSINQVVPWWELTRINRKDLVASLIFGIRVSIVVGISAVTIALLIGIPLGSCSGYFAGKLDLFIARWIEIWEAMPTFFMLLLIIALTQSKSIFLVIAVLGIFGWTSFGRFIRAEVFKQRSLPYVLACRSLGYSHRKIIFSHILPNAIPPILTLLPFAMMAAISSEAGLSFLGLGEEGATSWGVLMDEGRSVFPAESYLLWPPAILLTLLLISIALIGDVIRDAIDPKLRS